MSPALRRLALRLEQPPPGRSFRLQWFPDHLALVIRGELLLEASGEAGPPVRLLSPATGRLYRTVPSGDRVSPAAILGEVEYGQELDRQHRLRAESVRQELRDRLRWWQNEQWLEACGRYQAAEMRALVLTCDIFQYEGRTQGYAGLPLPIKAGKPQRVAAALLEALRKSPPDPLSDPVSASDRERMMAVAGRLGEMCFLPGRHAPPPEPVAEIRQMQTAEALARRYDSHIAACQARISDFPPELQQAKLDLWREIKQDQLRRLYQEND